MHRKADGRKTRSWSRTLAAAVVTAISGVGAALVPATAASAATQTVTNCADSGPGSLRQALASAAANDTVAFDLAPACSTITLTSGPLAVATDLTITGPGSGALAVSGGGVATVMDVAANAGVTVSGLTIDDGNGTDGGGIMNLGDLTLADTVVSGNVASFDGGGIDNANGATLNVGDSTLSDNNGAGGGAIYNDGKLSVVDSTLSGNTAGTGAGVLNDNVLSLSDSTVADNTASFGGGFYNHHLVSIVASTLAGNTATGRSGLTSGGGFYNDAVAADVTMASTIVAENGSGNDSAGGDTDQGDNVDDDGTCGFTSTTGHSDTPSGLDPAGLAANGGPTDTIALLPGSAAVGAVDNPQLCADPDQRGHARPVPCDIGAFQTAAVTVTTCGNSGPGSLRQAVLDAAPDTAIGFALSPPCPTITLATPISLSANVAVDGPGAGTLALSGANDVQVFDIPTSVTAQISGLTIENGVATNNGSTNIDAGGGIDNQGTLTVSASTFAHDSALLAGGAIENDGILDIADSTFSSDSASQGGAISNFGQFTVSASTFSDDSASSRGGAILNVGSMDVSTSTLTGNTATTAGGGAVDNEGSGTGTITTSTLSGNSAGAGGGAVQNLHDLTVSDSTVTGNRSVWGGGIIDLQATTMTVSNSTVAGNSVGPSTATNTEPAGGGLDDDGGTVTIDNSTVAGNTAPGSDGADLADQAGSLSTTATIVAGGGTEGDCAGAVSDDGFNLADDSTCGFTAATDRGDTPAGLDPMGLDNNGGPTNTIALDPGSAAIGAVTTAALCATPDQRGVARPTPCDIGAVQMTLLGQTVSFTSIPPPGVTVGGTYLASATATSGLPVSLTIDATASSVCSLTGATVTFTGAGTCVVDAQQNGNDVFAPAPSASQGFPVAPVSHAFTNADTTTVTARTSFSFALTTVGSPVPTITRSGRLPAHVRLVAHADGTATLTGVARKPGTYPVTFRAVFGQGKTKIVVHQSFTLVVSPA